MVAQAGYGLDVNVGNDVVEAFLGEGTNVCFLGEVAAKDPVLVLITSSLPGGIGIREIGEDPEAFNQFRILAELGPVFTGNGLPVLWGEGRRFLTGL